jgi:hypothetical protein
METGVGFWRIRTAKIALYLTCSCALAALVSKVKCFWQIRTWISTKLVTETHTHHCRCTPTTMPLSPTGKCFNNALFEQRKYVLKRLTNQGRVLSKVHKQTKNLGKGVELWIIKQLSKAGFVRDCVWCTINICLHLGTLLENIIKSFDHWNQWEDGMVWPKGVLLPITDIHWIQWMWTVELVIRECMNVRQNAICHGGYDTSIHTIPHVLCHGIPLHFKRTFMPYPQTLLRLLTLTPLN